MRMTLPLRAYGAYIFDCDGTLVDSMPGHFQAWRRALREGGARFEFSWELFLSRAGMGLPETVVELNRQFGCALAPDEVAAQQHRFYAESIPTLQPIEPVVEIARRGHGRLPMSVASGGDKQVVQRSLEHLGIDHWFEPVLCAADVPRGKPAPDLFLRCAELMGVPPNDCLVFEDGEMGMKAAELAGMAWVAADGSGRCWEP